MKPMFKIQGILFNVGIKREFGSNLVKKDFIVSRTGAGAYPNLAFEILGDEFIEKLDAIPLNSNVEVTFDIHGKSYTGKDGQPKFFNALRTYNVELLPPIDIKTEKSAVELSTEKAE